MFKRENLAEIGNFAFPIFLEQLAITLMGIFVSFMIAHISPQAVAGVSLVDNLNWLVQNFFLSMEVGAIVVVSQFRGKNDRVSASETVIQSMASAFILAVGVSVLLMILNKPVMAMILGDAEPAIYASGYTYFICALISFPFLAIYAMCAAGIRGSGYPKSSLIAVLVTNVTFMLLCVLFIVVFKFGVLGAGISLILSRIAGAATGILLLKKGNSFLQITNIIPKKIRWDIQKPVLAIGIPAGLENVIFMLGRLATQTFTVPLGTLNMAGNALANSIVGFYNIPGNTASSTITPIVGKYLGMGDKKKAKEMSSVILIITSGALVLTSVIMFLLARPIANIFSSDDNITNVIVNITQLCYLVSPIIWQFSFVIPAVLRASGDVKYTTTTSIISMLLVRVVCSYLLTTVFKVGIQGVWIAMYLDWLLRAILFGIRYLKGEWLNRKVIKD